MPEYMSSCSVNRETQEKLNWLERRVHLPEAGREQHTLSSHIFSSFHLNYQFSKKLKEPNFPMINLWVSLFVRRNHNHIVFQDNIGKLHLFASVVLFLICFF